MSFTGDPGGNLSIASFAEQEWRHLSTTRTTKSRQTRMMQHSKLSVQKTQHLSRCIIRLPIFNPPKKDQLFDDTDYWEVPEEEP
ncbi:hypothetical protein TNCV_3844111 [Trichonephila clavipes]|nr:hypothetical protein TNCV_3844111 [Trichonephila clavipes]